jgi:hypothetical protein
MRSKGRDPVRYFVKKTWSSMNIRAENGKYHEKLGMTEKNVCYKNVLLEVSRDDYANWCEAQREHVMSLQRPSIDRIDKSIGYRLSNMQIIELAENIRKDKTLFRDGTGRCFACKETKPEDEFVRSSARMNGRTTICRPCENARRPKKTLRKCPRITPEQLQGMREDVAAGLRPAEIHAKRGSSLPSVIRIRKLIRSGAI